MTDTLTAPIDPSIDYRPSAHIPVGAEVVDFSVFANRTSNAPFVIPLVLEHKIVTKDGRYVRLGDVIKQQQWDFLVRCQRQLDTRGQIRVCVLKARQIGVSTVIEAIIFTLAMLHQHIESLIVSHEDKSAAHILSMTRLFWDSYIYKRFYRTVYNGKNHLSWTNDSDIHIATAKNVTAGRSFTIRILHASEVAFWPDPDTLMTGLDNSIPSFGLNAIFLESTANGVGNYFHRKCNAAMRGDSEYEFFFYPWYEDPEYRADYLTDENQQRYAIPFVKIVKDGVEYEVPDLDEEELTLVTRYGVTLDRLIWRRWHIANKCNGDVDKFHQEMPTTPHEAFVATGRNVFHLPNLIKHSDLIEGRRGRLFVHHGKVEFVDDPRGYVTIFCEPAEDTNWGVYLIGADPTHTNQGDYACAQVLNRHTLEQVAVYRRKIDPITFGKDIQLLGRYYNTALLAPEKEGPGYATVGCVVGDFYPNVYQETRVDKAQGKPNADLFGWSTNIKSKELAVSHLRRHFNSKLLVMPNGQTFGILIHDEITLMELRDFVTAEKGLGYTNSDGSDYDDGVMALGIGAAVDAIEPKPELWTPADFPRPRIEINPDPTRPLEINVKDGTPRETQHRTDTEPPLTDDEIINQIIQEERARPAWQDWPDEAMESKES